MSKWLVRLSFAIVLTTAGASGAMANGACYDDRPCGSDSLPPLINAMIPQGFAGADFRPACRRHDACYISGCTSRKECDRQFLNDLLAASECSRHPVASKMVSRTMYCSVRLFGGSQFRQARNCR